MNQEHNQVFLQIGKIEKHKTFSIQGSYGKSLNIPNDQTNHCIVTEQREKQKQSKNASYLSKLDTKIFKEHWNLKDFKFKNPLKK